MRSAWALSLLAGLLAGGCASVLGIEDVTVESGEGGGGSGAATTTSTTGQGGSGGGCGDTSESPANCGVCGHDCQGGNCSGGRCQPLDLASGLNQPRGIAVDGARVWVAEQGASTVRSYLKADGTGGELLATSAVGVDGAFGIAVDDDGVYFTNTGEHQGKYGVMRCPKAPPCAPTLIDGPGTSYYPSHILVRDPYVYWMDAYDNTIERADKTTGAGKTTVAQPQNGYIGGEYAWFALDDAYVYWASRTPGQVARRALSGGAPQVLFSGQAFPSALLVDQGTLFWANAGTGQATGTVQSSPVGGAPAPDVLAVGQKYPSALALDATHVYWLEEGNDPGYTDGRLVRCARAGCGGTPEVLATDLADPRGLALDADAVYFATWGDGRVRRLVK